MARTLSYLGRGVSGGLQYRGGDDARLAANGLPKFETPEEIADAMGISPGELAWLTYHRVASPVDHYVLEGEICLVLGHPDEEIQLQSGEIYAVLPGRSHRVINGGDHSATVLVIQHGEYDVAPPQLADAASSRLGQPV